jgi:hypothetical protein
MKMEIRYIFHGGAREKKKDGTPRSIGIAYNGAFLFCGKKCRKRLQVRRYQSD